jgi:hypothetical protein
MGIALQISVWIIIISKGQLFGQVPYLPALRKLSSQASFQLIDLPNVEKSAASLPAKLGQHSSHSLAKELGQLKNCCNAII